MENLITFVISSITGIVTYLLGVRKARKETDGLALNNIEKSLDIYNTIIGDLRGQIEDLLDKVQVLEDKIDELKTENDELKRMLEAHDKKRK